ncbi:MAG: AraC family transcriptional regulator, partial [Paenibacillus sp.]|nr:AraC family transcriptional regulator [Paenibacillus sp.]
MSAVYPFHQDYMHNLRNAPHGQPRFLIRVGQIKASRLHHHEFGELSMFVEGDGFESINGVRHRIRPGTVSFVLPSHMHMIDSNPAQPLSKYCCCFDMQLLFGSGDDDDLSRLLYSVGT